MIYSAGVPGDQIGTVAVAVNGNGTFDFNGAVDDIAGLTVAGGSVSMGGGSLTTTGLTISGGIIDTGTGTLFLNGNLTYNSSLGGATPSSIAGNLDLVGGTRTFATNDGVLLNDLTIDAAISNGRVVKTGTGGLLLNNAANTFLAGINEVQRITVAGTTAGTSQFNINFNGNVTTTITVDAVDATTAAAIEAALRGAPHVGAGRERDGCGRRPVRHHVHRAPRRTGRAQPDHYDCRYRPWHVHAFDGYRRVAGINHTAGILSVGSDTALGSARVQLGNARLIAAGGDRTLTNNLVLNNNVTTVFGGQRDFGGTFDLTLTGGVTLHSSVNTGQVVNLDVLDTDTVVTMSGVISGGGNFIVPTKRGIGTLIWSGNNTFDVRSFVNASTLTSNDGIRLEGGILRVAHSNALGTSADTASVYVRGELARSSRSTAPPPTERSTSPAASSTSPVWTTVRGRLPQPEFDGRGTHRHDSEHRGCQQHR